MAVIGRLEAIGIGKEGASTPGTQVAATFWFPKESGTLKPIIEKVKDASGYGRIEEAFDSQTVREMSELQMEGIVRQEQFGLLLLAALGTDTPTGTGATPTSHLYTVDNTNDHPTLSVRSYADNASAASTYGMIDTLTITCDAGDYVKYSATLKGKKMTAESDPTVSFDDTDYAFMGKHVLVYFADTEAGLAGASVTPLERLELTISKNLLVWQALGDDDVNSIFNQQFSITGNFEGIFTDDTLIDYVRDSTKKFMKIAIINDEIDLDVGGPVVRPSLTFVLGKVSFESWDKTSDNNGIVKETIGFEAQFNNDEGYEIEATLVNLTDTY